MMQEVLTYIIVGLAIAYVIYKIITLFTKTEESFGCGGGCHCEAKKQFLKKP